MTLLDWSVFVAYFGAVVLVALRKARRTSGVEGFFLGNRTLSWGAIGLSVMATQASAITFIGTTGQAYDDGMEFIQVYLPQPLVMVILCVFFIPFFYRSRVYTAYEYLERRFDARTRSLTSFLFLLSRGMAAGIALYAPAVVLSVLLGWDESLTILIMGLITVAYTVLGGITAVIWTDVVQMLLMFAGIGVALVVLFWELPSEVGVSEVVYMGGIQQMWRSIDFSWDLSNTYTLWSGMIGGFFLALSYFGCDQSQVQRYLTAKSLASSRLSLIFNAFLKVPMQFCILAIGVLLFVFFHFERPPLIFNPAEARQVAASPLGERLRELEQAYEQIHQRRREAALELLKARREGSDLDFWHDRVRDYDLQLQSLRRESKELVRQVAGASSSDTNYVFPTYLIRYVPAGILGLMMAVIFAAAMSSLDSELTALSSATVIDFYRRYWRPKDSDSHYLKVSRLATLLWGSFAVLMALYAGRLGSLIEAVNRVGSYFYGSLLGVFVLGFLFPRVGARGAFWGLIGGMLAVFVVSVTTNISWLYYNVVGTLMVIAIGWLLGRENSARRVLPVILLVAILVLAPVQGQSPEIEEDQGITGLGLALRKLPTVGSVLYVTAHPDDENNAVLALLSRGMGLRTGLLTLTRGEGGQNEIGPELFEALGVLRTEELGAVHRFDGVQQFFGRAYEFGFSYSVEETFQRWGRQETVGDIVRVIRLFRPHVVISLNPEGEGGGQHHQASARLAAEAFRAAANPQLYPDQIREGLRPWQAQRLYQAFRPGQDGEEPEDGEEGVIVELDVGRYDPLLGESYLEFGSRARSRHRCQGMNVLPDPDPRRVRYRLVERLDGENPPRESLVEGMDLSLTSLGQREPALAADLVTLLGLVEEAHLAYTSWDFETTARKIMEGLARVRELRARSADEEVRFRLLRKEEDFLAAAAKAHFIHFDPLAGGTQDGNLVRGEEFNVEVRFLARGKAPLRLQQFRFQGQGDWQVEPVEDHRGSFPLFRLRVPADAPYSQPYWWLPAGEERDRLEVQPPWNHEPFTPPPLTVRAEYQSYGVQAWLERPVYFRWFDGQVGQERRQELQVLPRVSLSVQPQVIVFNVNDPQPRQLDVKVSNLSPGPLQAVVSLELPEGWQARPTRQTVQIRRENEEIRLLFDVIAPSPLPPGKSRLEVVAELEGERFNQQVQKVAYPHILTRHLLRPARAQLLAFPYQIPPDLQVGYIEGVGDEVGQATEQLGVRVSYLDEEDLARGDLSRFDVIVTGVRAYLNRKDLVAHNQRLLDYVREGGHLLVQYNKYEFDGEHFPPYPAKIRRPHDRVTAEDSPVRILEPEHPLFHWPNEIREEDFKGWVQERGLYFWGEWDPRYRPLLELQDPFPYNAEPKRGALVFAEFGRGSYVYTGLAFFRQLPSGVAGAYRLWANLLAYGRRSR